MLILLRKKFLEYNPDFRKPVAPLVVAIVSCLSKTFHIDGVGDFEFNILLEECENMLHYQIYESGLHLD
jgi:hypothetical protein